MTIAAKTRPVTTPPRGFRRSLNAFGTDHRSVSVMVGMLLVTLTMLVLPRFPPLSLIQQAGPWYDSFANAGVFVLLAMGLNVVIGMAGLLDLGYAAFFAIGAYTYAYSNSPFSGLDLPFYPMLFVGAGVAAVFGILLGAPTLRLRGDYLAIVTLGFHEIVLNIASNDPKGLTNGSLGATGISTFRFNPDYRVDLIFFRHILSRVEGKGKLLRYDGRDHSDKGAEYPEKP